MKVHKLIIFRNTMYDEFEPTSLEFIFLSPDDSITRDLQGLAYAITNQVEKEDGTSWIQDVKSALDTLLKTDDFKHLADFYVKHSDITINDAIC